MTKKLLALGAVIAAAAPSFATDLWDQQTGLGTPFGSVADSVESDIPANSTYDVSDVFVGLGGWNVSSVSVIAVDDSPGALNLTQAQLNVFSNTGSPLPLSSNNPTTGTTVGVSISSLGNLGANGGAAYLITASGLNLNLSAGEYWIGLTALSNSTNPGQFLTGFTTVNSAGATYGSAFNNTGGGLTAAGWNQISSLTGDAADYSAIDIQGTAAPEPASMTLLGLGIAGIIARRRNRK